MGCDDPNQLTCHATQRRLPFPQTQFACPSLASIWLPLVLLNARDRTNLSRHAARGTNLPFGKPSRDIGCRRSLIAGNARKKAASSPRRTLIMSRLMEISGRGLWIMRTRKACAPGTTTPRDDLGNGKLDERFLLRCVRRSLHRTAIALTQNSATPRMKLVGRVAFDEGGHIGGPSTVQTAGAKMCAFRAESEVCPREASIAQTRSDVV